MQKDCCPNWRSCAQWGSQMARNALVRFCIGEDAEEDEVEDEEE